MVEDTEIAVESGELFEHKWLFVIIPVNRSYQLFHSATTYIPPTEALLSAYCKHCDTYYTKALFWTAAEAFSAHGGLPRWGCIGPEGRF